MAETATYAIKALDETTWDAFAALVEANNGIFDGCWCMGFHAGRLWRIRSRRSRAATACWSTGSVGWRQCVLSMR
jgi:hypothetical protein